MTRAVVHISISDRQVALGPLELEVMDALWDAGTSNVKDIVTGIHRELAYTTVMTTLNRLHKKGLVSRCGNKRCFVYRPNLTRQEWNRRRAREMIASLLSDSDESRHLLLWCLVDAVGSYDLRLLDELENTIQRKRKELGNAQQK
jgi:predicted transcriptional regulator